MHLVCVSAVSPTHFRPWKKNVRGSENPFFDMSHLDKSSPILAVLRKEGVSPPITALDASRLENFYAVVVLVVMGLVPKITRFIPVMHSAVQYSLPIPGHLYIYGIGQ